MNILNNNPIYFNNGFNKEKEFTCTCQRNFDKDNIYNMMQRVHCYNLLEKLYIAKENMVPVIDEIIKNAKVFTELGLENNRHPVICSISEQQFAGAILASRILNEVNEDLNGMQVYQAGEVFKLPNTDVIVNNICMCEDSMTQSPRIYIDKELVKHLIELHEFLGVTICRIKEMEKCENAVKSQPSVPMNCAQIRAQRECCPPPEKPKKRSCCKKKSNSSKSSQTKCVPYVSAEPVSSCCEPPSNQYKSSRSMASCNSSFYAAPVPAVCEPCGIYKGQTFTPVKSSQSNEVRAYPCCCYTRKKKKKDIQMVYPNCEPECPRVIEYQKSQAQCPCTYTPPCEDLSPCQQELQKLQKEYEDLNNTLCALKSIACEPKSCPKKNGSLQLGRSKSTNSVASVCDEGKIKDVETAKKTMLECLNELSEVSKFIKRTCDLQFDLEKNVQLVQEPHKDNCCKCENTHIHAKLNGIPVILRLNKRTLDTILDALEIDPSSEEIVVPLNSHTDTKVRSNVYTVLSQKNLSDFVNHTTFTTEAERNTVKLERCGDWCGKKSFEEEIEDLLHDFKKTVVETQCSTTDMENGEKKADNKVSTKSVALDMTSVPNKTTEKRLSKEAISYNIPDKPSPKGGNKGKIQFSEETREHQVLAVEDDAEIISLRSTDSIGLPDLRSRSKIEVIMERKTEGQFEESQEELKEESDKKKEGDNESYTRVHRFLSVTSDEGNDRQGSLEIKDISDSNNTVHEQNVPKTAENTEEDKDSDSIDYDRDSINDDPAKYKDVDEPNTQKDAEIDKISGGEEDKVSEGETDKVSEGETGEGETGEGETGEGETVEGETGEGETDKVNEDDIDRISEGETDRMSEGETDKVSEDEQDKVSEDELEKQNVQEEAQKELIEDLAGGETEPMTEQVVAEKPTSKNNDKSEKKQIRLQLVVSPSPDSKRDDSDSSDPALPYTAGKSSLPEFCVQPSNDVPLDYPPYFPKLKSEKINHPKRQIEAELRRIGLNNLIKVSYPTKCCRKSVINEKPHHRLPYAPSIMSLPLDEDDLDYIRRTVGNDCQCSKTKTNTKTYQTYHAKLTKYTEIQESEQFPWDIPSYEIRFFNLFKKADDKKGSENKQPNSNESRRDSDDAVRNERNGILRKYFNQNMQSQRTSHQDLKQMNKSKTIDLYKYIFLNSLTEKEKQDFLEKKASCSKQEVHKNNLKSVNFNNIPSYHHLGIDDLPERDVGGALSDSYAKNISSSTIQSVPFLGTRKYEKINKIKQPKKLSLPKSNLNFIKGDHTDLTSKDIDIPAWIKKQRKNKKIQCRRIPAPSLPNSSTYSSVDKTKETKLEKCHFAAINTGGYKQSVKDTINIPANIIKNGANIILPSFSLSKKLTLCFDDDSRYSMRYCKSQPNIEAGMEFEESEDEYQICQDTIPSENVSAYYCFETNSFKTVLRASENDVEDKLYDSRTNTMKKVRINTPSSSESFKSVNIKPAMIDEQTQTVPNVNDLNLKKMEILSEIESLKEILNVKVLNNLGTAKNMKNDLIDMDELLSNSDSEKKTNHNRKNAQLPVKDITVQSLLSKETLGSKNHFSLHDISDTRKNSRTSRNSLLLSKIQSETIPEESSSEGAHADSDTCTSQITTDNKYETDNLSDSHVSKEQSTVILKGINSFTTSEGLLGFRNARSTGYVTVLQPSCGCPEIAVFVPCYCRSNGSLKVVNKINQPSKIPKLKKTVKKHIKPSKLPRPIKRPSASEVTSRTSSIQSERIPKFMYQYVKK